MAGLLRLCTAGSVDDGKSTLIGRLLYEARGVYEDQVRSVEAASRTRGVGPIDFSLFTDGLKAEREQGITIDVAYRYFATARRKFILADTPGHEQYTRNMATGASGSDLAIQAIPISALNGDNVTSESARTPWYDGPALLPYLERVDMHAGADDGAFRFPVQLVLRPDPQFRGYAGQIASGAIHTGDTVAIWPSAVHSRIRRIVTWDGDLDVAYAPMSVTLVLEDDVDVGRGDVIATMTPHVGRRFSADIVWMDERPLDPRRPYVLKHAARTVTAEAHGTLALNQIGRIEVETARPIAFDAYSSNRVTGSFILIDPATNFTAGAGMIAAAIRERARTSLNAGAAERLARAARAAASDAGAIDAVRDVLEELLT